MAKDGVDELSEDEKRALRGSKFAPLPSLPPPRSQPRYSIHLHLHRFPLGFFFLSAIDYIRVCIYRLAHPGGPLTTNKAAALAKFLERKLQDPNGLGSINPQLVERAVQNAKRTVFASKTLNSIPPFVFNDLNNKDLSFGEIRCSF